MENKVNHDEVTSLASRCVAAFIESFVDIDSDTGGWSKYYAIDPAEVGVWGTASAIIGICLGRELDVEMGRTAGVVSDMIQRACHFLIRHQIKEGRNRGAWSITQLRSPAFVDTTTIAIRALEMASKESFAEEITAGVRWLVSQQLDGGGWSNLERSPSARKIAKTCPTTYSITAIINALDLAGWTELEAAELRFRMSKAIAACKQNIASAADTQVVSGWGRDLGGLIPDPAYTALAVDALQGAGQASFIASHAASILALFESARDEPRGVRYDQAPWHIVRDIWTPPTPLAERFMTFFTTAWIVRSIGAWPIEMARQIADHAMRWLVKSDRGGKYFDYFTVPHNFASMDALWACRSYLSATSDKVSATPSIADTHLISATSSTRVFISYRRGEADVVAERLATQLRERGFDVWFDGWRVAPGDSLPGVLGEALRATQACIILLTPQYVNGRWASKEMRTAVSLAVSGKYRIIPVVIGDTPIPEMLHEFVYVNIDQPLADLIDRAVPTLVRGINPV